MPLFPIIDAGPVPEKGNGPFTQLVPQAHGGIGGMRYGSFAGKATGGLTLTVLDEGMLVGGLQPLSGGFE